MGDVERCTGDTGYRRLLRPQEALRRAFEYVRSVCGVYLVITWGVACSGRPPTPPANPPPKSTTQSTADASDVVPLCPEPPDRLSMQTCHEPQKIPNKRALLVGINNYQYEDIPDLQGTHNDVAAMHDVLCATLRLRSVQRQVAHRRQRNARSYYCRHSLTLDCARDVGHCSCALLQRTWLADARRLARGSRRLGRDVGTP